VTCSCGGVHRLVIATVRRPVLSELELDHPAPHPARPCNTAKRSILPPARVAAAAHLDRGLARLTSGHLALGLLKRGQVTCCAGDLRSKTTSTQSGAGGPEPTSRFFVRTVLHRRQCAELAMAFDTPQLRANCIQAPAGACKLQ